MDDSKRAEELVKKAKVLVDLITESENTIYYVQQQMSDAEGKVHTMLRCYVVGVHKEPTIIVSRNVQLEQRGTKGLLININEVLHELLGHPFNEHAGLMIDKPEEVQTSHAEYLRQELVARGLTHVLMVRL